MRLLGFDISSAGVRWAGFSKQLTAVSGLGGGWRRILESFSGAWQQNVEERLGTLLCYPTLYACLSRIAQDIGKLPFTLVELGSDGVWSLIQRAAFNPVLLKPNHYQTAQQFREAWMLSKLQHGNTYVLKRRDNRNVVTALYILDPDRVMPVVSESGDVFYRLNMSSSVDLVPGIVNEARNNSEYLTVPAREIIHDRMNCFHHQLIGVPPVCAAHWPAVKNLKILKSAATFFQNHGQPGGILTTPAGMSDDDAKLVKAFWQENYSGDQAGKVAVIGADMKFTSFAMKSADSQLVEQMRYSDEQICQPFGIPPFKIGIGVLPTGLGVDGINQLYYADALQPHIEAIEALLDEGLAIEAPKGVELDLEPLLRMDMKGQAEVEAKLVSGKIKTPDEARRRLNLKPTAGGNTLWGQHQDYPLGILAERTDLNAPAPIVGNPADDAEEVDEEQDRAIALLWAKNPESLSHV